MQKFFKPNNDSRLAHYIGVYPQTVYKYKKEHPKKYDLLKRGWVDLCKEMNK